MTQIKEKTGICKSVIIATVVAIRDVVKNGFHCTDIDSLTTPDIHEVPQAEVLQYKEYLGLRAVSASGGISLDQTGFFFLEQC